MVTICTTYFNVYQPHILTLREFMGYVRLLEETDYFPKHR